MKNYFTLFLSLLVSFGSCRNRQLKNDLEKFLGTKLTIPANLQATFNGKDTLLTDFIKEKAKLVVWIDSTYCSSCQISKMYEWKEILSYADSIGHQFSVLFLFTPKKSDLPSVRIALQTYKIDYPVFLADHDEFIKPNPFLPEHDHRMHTFLLDADNKALLAGNPVNNSQLWELYKSVIEKLVNKNSRLPEQLYKP